MFEGCTNLKKVTIPVNASFTTIGANNFKNCNKLERINVQCAVPSLTVGSNAFNGNDVIISVMTADDKAIVDAALKTASITNVTVVAVSDSTEALSADGFSVRTEDYTGLRSIFSFNSNLIPYYASSGLTLSEYGALMMSSDNFESMCGNDEEAMYDLGVAGTSSKVKYIPVYKMVDGVQKGRNKYLSVENGIYTYCVTLTGIPEANYKDDVYICAYAKWVDEGGNETLEFTHYTDTLGQDARSLYDPLYARETILEKTAEQYSQGIRRWSFLVELDLFCDRVTFPSPKRTLEQKADEIKAAFDPDGEKLVIDGYQVWVEGLPYCGALAQETELFKLPVLFTAVIVG